MYFSWHSGFTSVCVSGHLVFCPDSTSPFLWKRSQAESTCMDFYRLSTVFLDHPLYLCKWQPTPGFLPGKSHGQRSLVGYSPCGHKESDTTEWLHFSLLKPEARSQIRHKTRLTACRLTLLWAAAAPPNSGSRDGREREGMGSLHPFLVGTSPRVCKDLEKSLSPSTL